MSSSPTALQPLCEELKKARVASGITLEQIADSTMININFLRALENGNTTILPEAYVRAFLREYASCVGLDPAHVMQRYDALGVASAPPPPLPPPPKPAAAKSTPALSPKRLQIAGVTALALVGIFVLWRFATSERPVKTNEIPFQRILKEAEGSTHGSTPAPASGATRDSITLHAAATDTVWMEVICDRGQPREYMLYPGSHLQVRAHDLFVVTLGNAGGVRFSLNDLDLGRPGKRGTVVRNLEISRALLGSKGR